METQVEENTFSEQIRETSDAKLSRLDLTDELVLEPIIIPDGVDTGTAQPDGFSNDIIIPSYHTTGYSARGYFMIFNHDKFHARTRQSDRKGSSKDVEMLQERFSQLEFEVEVFNNLTEREIKKTVAEYARKDHGKCQMFGMAILTHGVEHGKLYAFDEFINPFKPSTCPTLTKKPKLFFVQACRGSGMDHGVRLRTEKVSNSQYSTWPLDGDILIHFATPEGNYAWRDTRRGSWFMQALCNRLRYAYSMEFHHLLIQVNAKVAADSETIWRDQLCKEMPQILSQLTKQLYLKPISKR